MIGIIYLAIGVIFGCLEFYDAWHRDIPLVFCLWDGSAAALIWPIYLVHVLGWI